MQLGPSFLCFLLDMSAVIIYSYFICSHVYIFLRDNMNKKWFFFLSENDNLRIAVSLIR